jgi:hypothetical protein
MKQLHFAFFVITFLTSVLYSCEQETEEVVSFPITLYASEISEVNDIRLFVKDKEVFDIATINHFIDDDFRFDPNSIRLTEADTMVFNSMDSVTFESNHQKHSVHKTADQFLFYSADYMMFVVKQISFLKHRSDQIIVPLSSGYQYAEKEVMVGYGSFTNFELCLLMYKLHEYSYADNQLVHRAFSAGHISNEFNEDFIPELGITDTLAIREIKIRFVRK